MASNRTRVWNFRGRDVVAYIAGPEALLVNLADLIRHHLGSGLIEFTCTPWPGSDIYTMRGEVVE